MSNNVIKDMFDEKFNKEKINIEVVNKIKKQKKQQLYYLFSLVLILLVSGSFFFESKYKQLNSTIKDNYNKEYKNEDKIYVNDAKIISSSDINGKAVDFDEDSILLEQSLNNISLPKELSLARKYMIYTNNQDSLSDEYNILHDYVYIYNNSDNSKEVTIALSLVGLPLKSYKYYDIGKESIINNNEVIIYGSNDYYNIIFEYNKYNFDIETRNITLEELTALLKSIIV